MAKYWTLGVRASGIGHHALNGRNVILQVRSRPVLYTACTSRSKSPVYIPPAIVESRVMQGTAEVRTEHKSNVQCPLRPSFR